MALPIISIFATATAAAIKRKNTMPRIHGGGASVGLAILLIAALYIILSLMTPTTQALNVYRLEPEKDLLAGGFSFSPYDGQLLEGGLYDASEVEEADMAVESSEVRSGWRGLPEQGLVLAHEVAEEAFTLFVFELQEEDDADELQLEKFGPLTVYLVGQPEQGAENDIMGVKAYLDASTGSMLYEDMESDVKPVEVTYPLRVQYHCKKPGTAQVAVYIPYFDSQDQYKNITFVWNKTCGSGTRKGFSIAGMLSGDDAPRVPVVKDGVAMPDFAQAPYEHQVPVGVSVAKFVLKMEDDLGSQDFLAPVITVSKPELLNVYAHDEGSVDNGLLVVGKPLLLIISHHCNSYSEEEIEITLKYTIGSYTPVSFGWRKSCSPAGPQPGLKISTSSANQAEVYNDGKVNAKWEQPSVVVDNKTTSSSFYFTAASTLRFNTPRLTVEPPHYGVRAWLVGKNGDLMGSGDTLLIDKSTTELQIKYQCFQRGRVTIRLSMFLTDMHSSIQWTWTKECPALPPRPTKRVTVPYLTANRAMFLFTTTVIVVCGLVLWFYSGWQRRQRELAEARRRAIEEETYA